MSKNSLPRIISINLQITILSELWKTVRLIQVFKIPTAVHFNHLQVFRDVTKISSCRVNTKSRRGMKQPGIFFGSIFLLFSYEVKVAAAVAGENHRPPPLNDSPIKVCPSILPFVLMLCLYV